MARLPYVNREELPEADREIFDNFVAERKEPVGHVFRMVAHAPHLLRRWLAFSGELRNGTKLDPKLREMALLTVGRLNRADYEFAHHWNMAVRAGVSQEKLEQLAEFETSPLFTSEERAVMRYAIESTRDVKVSDATFDAVRKLFDNRRLMELIVNVAYYNMVTRVLVATGVEVESSFKRL